MEKLYSEYFFIEKDKNKFRKTFIFKISTIPLKITKENDLYVYLLNKSTDNIYIILDEKFKNGQFVNIISNYINDNFKSDNITLADFIFIDMLLVKTNYQCSFEDICSILEISIIDKLVTSLCDENSSLINKQNYSFLNNSVFLKNLVETYQTLNDFDLEENNGIKEDDEYFSDNITAMYLKEIKKYPLLSVNQERELAIAFSNGDIGAKEKLINHNLRLSVYVAKNYQNRGLPFLELIQEGNIGLIKAIENFDVNKGFKLSTYALWWIRQAVTRSLQDNGKFIRIPVHMYGYYARYQTAKNNLQKYLNREPKIEEIAKEMKVSIDKVKEIEEVFNINVTSINLLVGDDNDSELGDFIPSNSEIPEDVAMKNRLKKEVTNLLEKSRLTQREKDVLKYRFGLNNDCGVGMTLEEVGKIFRITRERVRQIEAKALDKLTLVENIEQYAVYLDDPTQGLSNLVTKRAKKYANPKRSSKKVSKVDSTDKRSKNLVTKKIKLPILEDKNELINKNLLNTNKKASENNMENKNTYETKSDDVNNISENNSTPEVINEPKNNLTSQSLEEKKDEKVVAKAFIKKRPRGSSKDLDVYFSQYDRNLRNLACENLSENYAKLMHKAYGDDLINFTYNDNLTYEEKRSLIVNVLRRYEKNLKELSELQHNNNNSEQPISSVKIDVNDDSAVKGGNLEDSTTVSNSEVSTISKKETYDSILSIFDNPVFIEMTKTKSLEECVIVSLMLGLGEFNGKNFSSSEIADFLGIDVERVNLITKNALVEFKAKLNEMIDIEIENKCVKEEKNPVKIVTLNENK